MAAINPSGSIYPRDPLYGTSYKYDDPIDPQIPQSYSGQFENSSQQSPPNHGSQSRTKLETSSSSEPKVRLRKACDSCSVRKVKCDESGPPCKSCAALDIPCTFERPSRRRGPPNRHAEAIKRQKLGNGSYRTSTGSPTHDAAYSLASLSGPSPLSAESICDISLLEVLIDDYFVYIHPLIPLPHEPTFRAAFARREDRTDRSFLCVVATMLETLVASFPRKPLRLFTSEQARHQFPNASALIDKCHQVFGQARGAGHLDHELNLNDALSSYLAGLAGAYQFDIQRMRLYFGECVMTLRGLGFHRAEVPKMPQKNSSGSYSPVDQQLPNYIYQESGRRLFWLMFVGAMSGRQLDDPEADLLMPPVAYVEMLPPLPLEVDDQYLTERIVYPQPVDTVSVMTGFNLNAKVFKAFHTLAALETAFGTQTLYDLDRQRQVIRRTLQNVKAATLDAPKELQLIPSDEFGEWPPPSYNIPTYSQGLGEHHNTTSPIGFVAPDTRTGVSSVSHSKRSIQFEIQKANIYATQLASRSFLVEKFWNLYEISDRDQPSPIIGADKVSTISSPTAGAVIAGVDHRFHSFIPRTPSDSQMDVGEQAMAVEREDIVRDLAVLLQSINQVNMEPNGISFCNKIRQVASTLLETKRARMSVMPTLDSETVNNYLYGFMDILSKLERLGPGRIHAGDMDPYGTYKSAEEIEEEELVHWASLKEHQERFVRNNRFLVGE